MKTVLFVPGFGEDMQSRDYASVLQAIEAKGYETAFVQLHWKRTTIVDWAKELQALYDTYDPSQTILAGFSYGAMTALAVAAERQPSELWLFSLSPYFAEDLPRLKKSWLTKIGHRRVSAFRNLSFTRLASDIACPVKVFAGEGELQKWPATKHRFENAAALFAHCRAIIVPTAGHEVDHPDYISAIKDSP